MKIANLNELYNYIKTKEPLTTNCSLMQLVVCVDQYKNICINCLDLRKRDYKKNYKLQNPEKSKGEKRRYKINNRRCDSRR